MNDLIKRLREVGASGFYDDENGTPLTYHPASLTAICREAADALDARWQTMESAPDGNDEVLMGYMHSVAGWAVQVAHGSIVRRVKQMSADSALHAPHYWHPLPPPPEDV